MRIKIKCIVSKILPNSRFARNVSVLAGGAIIGQILVVLASPLISRLYTPEDFGLFSVFSSLLGIVGVIASLRYQLAIPLPEDEEEASNLTVLSLFFVVVMSLFTALIVVLCGDFIAKSLNIPQLSSFMWLVPIGLFFIGIYEVLNYWAIRRGEFGSIAKTKLFQSLGTIVIQIGGYSIASLGLMLGKVIGQASGIVTLSFLVFKNRSLFYKINASGVIDVLSKYRAFPLVSTWSALSNIGAARAPTLLLAITLGPEAAGLYAFTVSVMSLPVNVISKSMGDVFFNEAIKTKEKDKLGFLVTDVYAKLVSIGLPLATFMFVVAPTLFTFVFGENWVRSGELASWLTISVFFQFITTPPGKVFLVLERHGIALFFQLLFLIYSITSIVVGSFWFAELNTIVFILAIGRSLIYCFRFLTILSFLNLKYDRLILPLIKSVPYTTLCILPILYLEKVLLEDSIGSSLSAIFFILAFFLALVPSIRIYLGDRN